MTRQMPLTARYQQADEPCIACGDLRSIRSRTGLCQGCNRTRIELRARLRRMSPDDRAAYVAQTRVRMMACEGLGLS